MLRNICPTIVVLFVAACTSDPAPTNTYSTVAVFSDGYGVTRSAVETTAGNLSIVGIGPDAAALDGLSVDDVSPVYFDTNSLTYTGSDNFGYYYTGNAYIGPTRITATVYFLDDFETYAVYGQSAYGSGIATAGPLITNQPTEGVASYQGNFVIGDRFGGGFTEFGSFAMDVNFNTNLARIQGNTNNSSLTGLGMAVNSDGTIDAENLTLVVNSSSYNAKLHGNLHGDGATSNSGVFYEDSANPLYAGAFLGR